LSFLIRGQNKTVSNVFGSDMIIAIGGALV
jgi:hypothetical protein